jgi:hypothetical protein
MTLLKGALMVSSNVSKPLENDTFNPHALLSWRSIVAGLLISVFTMIGLLGLGLAFGGIGLDEDTTAKGASIFTGVWFLLSALVSLFVGSYFAARVSKFRMGRIGSAQGLVIAALFLGIFLYQTVAALGTAGSTAGAFLGRSGSAIATGAGQAADSPAITSVVQNLAEDALGELNLRSEPSVVAQGVGSRLIQGNTESAKNYLAREAGITPTEADARIAEMRLQVESAMASAKEGAATALKSTGWSLFLLVLLGALSAVAGGGLGSVVNFRKPLIRENDAFLGRSQHA